MNKETNVYGTSKRILTYLENTRSEPSTRAILAELRNSINKDLGDSIESLAFIFSMIPEDKLGIAKNLNYYEQAVLTTLQLYAIYQQGEEKSVIYKIEDYPYKSLGKSLRTLRNPDDQKANKSIDLRFNSLISSTDYKMLNHHLRQIIKLLKAKSEEQVDFFSLSNDLYAYLLGDVNPIKIKWARDYYWNNTGK